MELALKILKSHSISTDDDIIVIGQSRVFSIISHDFDIETSAVLDRKCLVVEFAQNVDVLVVDLADTDGQGFFLLLLCHLTLNFVCFIVICYWFFIFDYLLNFN